MNELFDQLLSEVTDRNPYMDSDCLQAIAAEELYEYLNCVSIKKLRCPFDRLQLTGYAKLNPYCAALAHIANTQNITLTQALNQL